MASRRDHSSMLYRMPLDGSGPSALGVSGSPVDQFSFLESEDKHLNVLVRSDSSGDGMWGAEVRARRRGADARAARQFFNDGSDSASSWDYHRLPKPAGYTFQNRFVGDYLLYGTGSGWGAPENKNKSNLYAVRWTDGETERADRSLTASIASKRWAQTPSSSALTERTCTSPRSVWATRRKVADEYIRKGASQGELRSQGFFYKPDGPDSGMLGLPISVPGAFRLPASV